MKLELAEVSVHAVLAVGGDAVALLGQLDAVREALQGDEVEEKQMWSTRKHLRHRYLLHS